MALNEGFENIKIFNFQNGENILSVTIKEIIDNINIIYTWDCALYLSCFLISHSDVKNTIQLSLYKKHNTFCNNE